MPPQQNQENLVSPQIRELMRQFKANPNAQAAQQNLLNQYPQLQAYINLAQKHNVNLQQIAQIMAQQKGVNLDTLMRELQQLI